MIKGDIGVSETSMAVKIEDVSPVKKKMTFEIPWEDAKQELDKVFQKVGKTAKIKGFRPGKIPRPILENYYKEYAEEETINNLINRFYWGAIEENKITPLSQPQIDQQGLKRENAFSFSATIEVEPVIEPKDYTDLKLEKKEWQVSPVEVESQLKHLQEMYSTMEDVAEERAVQEGDFVAIDFQGFLDEKPQKDMQADNYLLEIGSKSFVPGFEEQIVGMKTGEKKEIKVTFPENYQKKALAEKDVVFHVTLKSLKEKKLPEVNEEFVKNFEQYETLADLKDDIVKGLEERNKERANGDLRSAVVSKLLESNVFEIPESLVERQIYYMMADTHRRMSMQGMDSKVAADLIPKMRDMYKEEAARSVKSMLLIKSIAAKEAIVVDKEEIDDYVKQIAQQRAQNFDTIRESFEKEGILAEIESDLLSKKVFAYIESKAEITLVPAEQTDKTEKEEAV